jgi:hypothetical protein
MRPAVRALLDLGPLPSSANAEPELLEEFEKRLKRITRPVTPAETRALCALFGPDECFGLAWSLLGLIETAPGGVPFAQPPGPEENEWIQRLWRRAHREPGDS